MRFHLIAALALVFAALPSFGNISTDCVYQLDRLDSIHRKCAVGTQLLLSQTGPGSTASLASAKLLVGSSLAVATARTITGVVAFSNTGVTTFGGTASGVTTTELALIDGADRLEKVGVITLTALDTAGGVASWANPTGGTILITRLVVDVTTKSSAASTVDCGVAADGTTLSDTLIDGADFGTAAGLFDTFADKGTNGGYKRKATTSQFVTCSKASGAAAGLVGKAYVYYHAI